MQGHPAAWPCRLERSPLACLSGAPRARRLLRRLGVPAAARRGMTATRVFRADAARSPPASLTGGCRRGTAATLSSVGLLWHGHDGHRARTTVIRPWPGCWGYALPAAHACPARPPAPPTGRREWPRRHCTMAGELLGRGKSRGRAPGCPWSTIAGYQRRRARIPLHRGRLEVMIVSRPCGVGRARWVRR